MARIMLVLVTILVSQYGSRVHGLSTYVNTGCDATFNYTEGSAYEKNLNLLLTTLTSKSSSLKFYNSTVGDASNKVYGLFQCRFDVGLTDCSKCVTDATQKINQKCHLNGKATVWYYECMLRYSNLNIFGVSDISFVANIRSLTNVSNYAEFSPILANTMNMLINNASSASEHFVSSITNLTLFDQLYSFAQCTPDLDSLDCLRYDTTGPFLKEESSPTPNSGTDGASGASTKTTMNPAIIGAIVACVLVGLLVLSIVVWICMKCKIPEEPGSDVLLSPTAGLNDGPGPGYYDSEKGDKKSLGDTDFEQYDFNTLETATKGFSAEVILGKGGFGNVYKGILENGEQLAIKRLSKDNSGQGAKEFMAEARLLAKLQHRNLVKLVGFCSQGDEKLLVYEFLSNASLDRFLFDPDKRSLLDWATRSNIIMGIARGLQYLHKDSRLIIIHRDLKPANILLDKEMNPKIADFGLAKLFESAQEFGNTNRIAGTQGYMAPEYLMSGEYSDKSDVYSFGIMLLEIVSGQRNREYKRTQQKEDLSIQAWRLWTEGRSFEITDPVLINNCSTNDVMRYIQIGLLCIQANAEERPAMTAVVLMLTSSVELQSPSPPMMTFNPYNMPMNYSGTQNSDVDCSSTKSVTMTADSEQDHNTFTMARIVLVFVSILVCRIFITIDAQATYVGSICEGTDFNYTEGSVYEKNLNLLFKNFTSKSSTLKFYKSAIGAASNEVYGLFQCRNDIGLNVCNSCVKDASQMIIEECPLSGEGVVWYYECMLRYANRDISLYETFPGYFKWHDNNVTNYAEFGPILAKEINGVIKNASSASPHFAYSEANFTLFENLYTFAQCTPDIDSSACNNCLKTALSDMIQCCNASLYTMIFLPSCQLSYTMSLVSIINYTDKNIYTEFKQYDFNTLKIATRDFSDETKLGEGGFGVVYKGTLKNGQQLAIKRLSKGTTGQGTKEFMTEAQVVAKLQHRNLVKLVGFCLEGDEKLLVYEFMPNASLDRFLFDPKRRLVLDWTTRNKIIMGTARGLQYLHEDSRLTIIHRDLKPANILLDKEMIPKVADFGLAKLFGGAQDFGHTLRIVGTQGYMAPEYLMSGEFSAKSDVYSFGIMLLEIVSGQKNRISNRSQQNEDLSIRAWRLWNEDRSLDITDPVLLHKCPSNELKRCIHIGLLCIQNNAEERPTMGAVVLMLTCAIDLPLPSPPMMTSAQHSVNMSYTGGQRSDADQFSTNSVTMRTDMAEDLYPRAR
ncbi:uncharacterized protein LOC141590770 [Silene latifolia]|uniref:uncharacterized protein LOC141590770 n=1 Tax=Silene latifolia TaxID=37657 RepID=UPI003D77A4DB